MRISDWSSDVCSSDLCKQAISHVFTPLVNKAKSLLERGLVRKCPGCSLHPSLRTVRRLVRFGSECSCVLSSRERVDVNHAFIAIPQHYMSDGRRSLFIQSDTFLIIEADVIECGVAPAHADIEIGRAHVC